MKTHFICFCIRFSKIRNFKHVFKIYIFEHLISNLFKKNTKLFWFFKNTFKFVFVKKGASSRFWITIYENWSRDGIWTIETIRPFSFLCSQVFHNNILTFEYNLNQLTNVTQFLIRFINSIRLVSAVPLHIISKLFF